MNVFFNQESPYHGIQYKHVPPNFFNITMTYRSDSDVIIPYDKLELIDKITKEDEIWTWKEVQEKVSKKTKLVLQLVSNCYTESKREVYATELAKYINITVYGKCNKRDCNKECENEEIG
uniref:Fucosyltransferase n=1 Tax=Acrobeloides nanus TaxID=290746 RepID=A0A914BUD4_9BILA